MERLTPEYITTDFENVEKSTREYCKGQIPMFAGRSVLDYIHRLAELEDKIEGGTLIELPCKFEITIYWVDNRFSKIAEVEEIKTVFLLDEDRAEMTQYNFGKEAFFTREEAEKRLEGLKICAEKRNTATPG